MQNNITGIISKKRKNKQKNTNNCEILSHKEKKCTIKIKILCIFTCEEKIYDSKHMHEEKICMCVRAWEKI